MVRTRGREVGAQASRHSRQTRGPRVQVRWRWGLCLLLLLTAGYGCSVRDPWEDARIESEVKARLVAERSANLTRLGVVSRQAVVYLTGTVTSTDDKALAEGLARDVAGVRRIVSTLEVRPARASAPSP